MDRIASAVGHSRVEAHLQAAHLQAAHLQAIDRAIERQRHWGQVSVAVFRRAGGRGGIQREAWHRILLAPSLVGPVALRLGGGPARRVTPLPGTIGFYPAGADAILSHAPGQVIQVLQDPILYRGLMAEIGGGADPSVEPLINFADPLVAQIARSLALEVEGGPADRLLADALSMALAARVARRFPSWRPPPKARAPGLSRERLRRVLDHVEAHLGAELTLAELAATACLSTFHFSRCFKRAVGVGVQRYVARRRVERARAMLRRTEEPLADIAQRLGFADQSHFTKVFRRETGDTPARFRGSRD